MASVYELANLSALAYDSTRMSFGEWLRIDREGPPNGEGFYAELYANARTREAVMSIRGTDFDNKDKSDLISDAQLALGLTPNQFHQAKKAYNRFKFVAKRRLGDGFTGYLTGHSLGGGLASLLAVTSNGVSTVTFNAPGMKRVYINRQGIALIGHIRVRYLDTNQLLHMRATGDAVSVGTGAHMGKVEEVYVDRWGDEKILGASRHLAQHSITHMVNSLARKQWWRQDLVRDMGWQARSYT